MILHKLINIQLVGGYYAITMCEKFRLFSVIYYFIRFFFFTCGAVMGRKSLLEAGMDFRPPRCNPATNLRSKVKLIWQQKSRLK